MSALCPFLDLSAMADEVRCRGRRTPPAKGPTRDPCRWHSHSLYTCIGKDRFVEGASLGDIVIEPEERRDGSLCGCPCWLGLDGPVPFLRGLPAGGRAGDGIPRSDVLVGDLVMPNPA